jgi:hypothetical protein
MERYASDGVTVVQRPGASREPGAPSRPDGTRIALRMAGITILDAVNKIVLEGVDAGREMLRFFRDHVAVGGDVRGGK